MNKIKSYKNEIYWTEKGENFIKLCFAFSPELHEDLEQLNFIYTKIAENIETKSYKIFAVHKNKNQIKLALSAYSVDLYGDAVQNKNWDI